MKPFGAIAAVLALFVVGILVGALGTHLYYAHELREFGGPHELIARGFEDHLRRALDLTPEQMTRIEDILREGRQEGERIRGELAPRVQAHMERIHARLLEVLTPEQRERFEELHRRQRHRSDMFFFGPWHEPHRH